MGCEALCWKYPCLSPPCSSRVKEGSHSSGWPPGAPWMAPGGGCQGGRGRRVFGTGRQGGRGQSVFGTGEKLDY
jgi:hypothetical protein